jgi:hypothetical protein
MIGHIVAKYRTTLGDGKRPLSYRKFAEGLSTCLRPFGELSHAAVYQWERGNASPDYWMLVYLSGREGWPGSIAREMLHEVRPDVWPVGEL